MKKEILNFIKENKIATIACSDENNKPYCFHCFYIFDEINNMLFFKSSLNTYHSKAIINNPGIAGSILPNKIDFIALKGIQFTGIILTKDFPDDVNPNHYYHKKLPLALAKPGNVFCIKLEMVKMSDNTNIFGEKLLWQRSELISG
ncbi:pyridoxamine 5'-phosphate oxidase family protein [Pedobacter sp. P351]|uniref:pyridoxamine 5'-phosphate oxidase family protein n=1 Tax=Pedobacter superstes TaxID=3133441 RepID=UPI0030B79F33